MKRTDTLLLVFIVVREKSFPGIREKRDKSSRERKGSSFWVRFGRGGPKEPFASS